METGEEHARPSIAFYSHDGFGLGHLSRSLFLAGRVRQITPEADIHIVTSSPEAHRLQPLHDFAWIKLPSVTKTGVERYRPHRLSVDLEQVIALRSALLLSTVQNVRPDVLVVDHRPLGLEREALPALEWLRKASPGTQIVVGLRDIIDDPSTVRRNWQNQGIYDALDTLFDHVLVYGERSVIDCTQLYAMPGSVRRKTRFVGYLGRGAPRRSRDEVRASLGLSNERLVVVHAGGGGDGADLIDIYLRTAHLLPNDIYSFVVTGPLMDRGEQRRLRANAPGGRMTVVEYQEDLSSYVAAADLSISMGGYNTICEVLSAGVRNIVVPRIYPRKEQYIRAQLLAARGLIRVVLPNLLRPDALSAAIHSALESPRAHAQPVELNGGPRAGAFLSSLLRREAEVGNRLYAWSGI